jgi:hypothetical protein
MMGGAKAPLDGSTLLVRIPMRFQRRGGGKRVVTPGGSGLAPVRKLRSSHRTLWSASWMAGRACI